MGAALEEAAVEAGLGETAGTRAYVAEIFHSFQGEGLFAGVRQVFVRFAGCDIRCPWCDTPDALVAKSVPRARIETTPDGAFEELPNPLPPERIVEAVCAMRERNGPVRWISLTGGEPAIWRRFLMRLCPLLKREGFLLALETNSRHPETLRAIRPWLDFTSADLKLPFADYDTSDETYRAFLTSARADAPGAPAPYAVGGKPAQVKVVVTERVGEAEIERAAQLVAEVDPTFPLILQPVTPMGDVHRVPSAATLLRLQEVALRHLEDVRILGQLHKMLSAR